jgi:phosphoribosylformimino-5-aminoimidazole carboxamide ribotide isomerase
VSCSRISAASGVWVPVTDRRDPQVILFPAIDLRGGRCVRLEQGSPDRETEYDTDPFRVAAEFVRQGAEWIHVVDLDAAFGDGSNRTLIAELARTVPARIQTGGGLRTIEDLEEVLASPVSRVVIGTAAIENPQLVHDAVERWGPARVAVGIDARGRTPAVRGWQEDATGNIFDIVDGLVQVGVETFIYTDISRDGMLSGPNLPMSVQLAIQTGGRIIVSGGIGDMADIEAVRLAGSEGHGIVGVIVGKAIYEGRIDLGEALRRLAE